MSYSSCSCFCQLDRTIKICVSYIRAVKIWCFEYNSLILTTGCSTWHLMANNSEDLRIRIVALHKDGRGYKKISNSLELSYSTVARVIQRFSKTGSTRNRPRKGRSKKLSPRAVCQVQKLASKNRCMSAASITLEVAELEGQLVSAQTIRHTLQEIRFTWPSSQKEASSEAGSQESPQTVSWRQPGQEHELLEPCPVVWWV